MEATATHFSIIGKADSVVWRKGYQHCCLFPSPFSLSSSFASKVKPLFILFMFLVSTGERNL
jgi:hypothetical protein